MTSLSPDLHARHHPYQHKYHAPYQPRPYYPQPDLSSPASEADLALDSKSSMGPLFHSSPSPSSAHRSSWSATSPHQRSHGPSVRTESSYPPSMRRTPPPISTHAWSPKHHHHSIPMRSPVRQHGQELMTTSASDTAPSEYMKMDYYDIYLQNPKLLRPEGGRNEAQGRYGSQRPRGTEPYEESRSYSTWSSGISRTKGRAPGSSDVIDSLAISSQDRKMKRPLLPPISSSSSSGFARTQPMAIRNLLADDDHEDPSHRQSSLESYSHHDGRSSRFESDTEISESGSMRWKEEDGDYVDRPYHYMASSSVMKRKQTFSDTSEPFGAPKKKRKSKKQAMAEAAAAAAAGISLPEDEPKKRKRTKKIQDPDHVSPAGFRHGGERVVQVPDELVVLEPDVGPVHMLDIESPPMVFWRGQPLSVVGKPGYDQLHPHEARIASTLRLSPAQYLSCKKTLILASRQFYAVKGGKQFRKSDAQKLCRIDVNKTSQLWEVFARIGWLEGLSAKDI
ncbi:hypothetical protein CPB97_002893 [Podila verticillata]|nr:hypothetical protein CPB97_002893 [Podila verticillata]